jgi:sulfur carrier protein ThiS
VKLHYQKISCPAVEVKGIGTSLTLREVVYDIELEIERRRQVTVIVQHSPILKLEGLDKSGSLEVPAGTTIQALLGRLGIPDNQKRYLLVYANGKKQTLSYTLRQDDALQLFLPIGGG